MSGRYNRPTLTFEQQLKHFEQRSLWVRSGSEALRQLVFPSCYRISDWLPPVTPRTEHIFYILLILRYLLRASGNNNEWAATGRQLIEPIAETDSYRRAMGMPNDWKEHPLWK